MRRCSSDDIYAVGGGVPTAGVGGGVKAWSRAYRRDVNGGGPARRLENDHAQVNQPRSTLTRRRPRRWL